ncbi:hypothetical protein W97_02002 [Coniosporium apollinis CBS 100218]|uniref:DUF647 domain-containing protein n=1 Tax=Coniosporium apollinis (strain CBS 100218) TaxID=1168221 RepID=R7YLH5_CONA1|nr:uncharacterized protein W97_02002 [Coniosporium apollinis CBS 100218]EON62777.1 hypothetical protein W97_02002 [Coniosporium apollinis CBS 100218]
MLELTEYDEAGVLRAVYVESKNDTNRIGSRVDIVSLRDVKTPWQRILDVFLPAGYPQSVTEDYIEYQIYDSLQAFSSSIAGLISSRAVLQGVGVGDASASPTAALLLSVLQDSMGRLATILFAHRLGTSLEPECKMYRLAADIFNDTAMILDCLSPAFPKALRVLVLSFSSILRALCGVAAGSSKATLSAHFAKWGNLGELNAKDSSQETIISLMGMLAGSVVVSWISSPLATWATLLTLLSIHLATNHAAVRAVSMKTLNRQRANIVLSCLMDNDEVLTPKQVSRKERIFERDGVLRWKGGRVLGHCNIGTTLQELLQRLGPSHAKTRSIHLEGLRLADLILLYERELYILWLDKTTAKLRIYIVLKQGCTPVTQLKAWTQALTLARHASQQQSRDSDRVTSRLQDGLKQAPLHTNSGPLAELRQTLTQTSKSFPEYVQRLEAAGWDLSVAALETVSGTRAVVRTKESS